MVRPTQRRPVLIGAFKTTLDGRTLSYSLKRSTRARYVRLEFRQGTLVVVIPRAYPSEDVPHFLEKKKRWILSTVDRLACARPAAVARELQSGDPIPYLGMALTVTRRCRPDARNTIALEGDCLVFDTRDHVIPLKAAVEFWYRREAEKLLGKRVSELSQGLGVTCGRITVRRARTRWGSCSPKGNLSFNWMLMMAPPPVIDYVIIHELAHILEMNHSARFWKLVAGHCPAWREHRRWLKEHEGELAAGRW